MRNPQDREPKLSPQDRDSIIGTLLRKKFVKPATRIFHSRFHCVYSKGTAIRAFEVVGVLMQSSQIPNQTNQNNKVCSAIHKAWYSWHWGLGRHWTLDSLGMRDSGCRGLFKLKLNSSIHIPSMGATVTLCK